MYTATVQITDVSFDADTSSPPPGASNAVVVSATLASLVTSPGAEDVFSLVAETGSPEKISVSSPTGDDDIIQLTFQLLGDPSYILIGIADPEPPSETTGSDSGRSRFPAIAVQRDSHGSQLTFGDRCSPDLNWDFDLLIQRVSDKQVGRFSAIEPNGFSQPTNTA